MAYMLPLIVGLAVVILYAVVGVESPAPPIVALVGLLGMMLGEQGGAYVKQRDGSACGGDTSPEAVMDRARHMPMRPTTAASADRSGVSTMRSPPLAAGSA